MNLAGPWTVREAIDPRVELGHFEGTRSGLLTVARVALA
jgi:hypothetical protein